ncbi:MAG: hypothetical protein WD431_22385 [Cyclobacteriaceae bacterium]
MGIDIRDFNKGDTIKLELDAQRLEYIKKPADFLHLHRNEQVWEFGSAPDPAAKGIHRNGTFKEPFNHRMIFVYGTSGNKAENNKARFDAETWYYRGNGAVNLVSDREFDLDKYSDRGIIVYGNADTNRAWKTLLNENPLQVTRKEITLGENIIRQDNLGAYFMVPRKDNDTLSIAVVSGTGLKGLHTTNANQYFAGGSGFPDFVVFTSELPVKGIDAIKAAGFYGNDWSLHAGE